MDEPDKKTKSSLLEDLICRLPLANAVPKKSAGERSRPCEFCPFQGSSEQILTRHKRLKHFAFVGEPSACYCPARGCFHNSSSSQLTKTHLEEIHPGMISLKTIVHEDIVIDGKGKPAQSSSPPADEGEWEVLNPIDSDSEIIRPLSIRKRKLSSASSKSSGAPSKQMVCEVEGCNYTYRVPVHYKIHFTKKHKKTMASLDKKDEESADDTITEPTVSPHIDQVLPPEISRPVRKEVSSPDIDQLLPETTRPARKKVSKRKFIDEVWEFPKKAKQELNSSSLEIKTHRLSVNLRRIPLNNDPLRKALIEIGKLHPDLNDDLSIIDGVIEKLVIEHAHECEKCKGSSEFMNERKNLSTTESNPKVSVNEVLNLRIQELTKQLKRVQESFDNLSRQQNSDVTYHGLLGGVAKPALFKKNDYHVVQGYRLIDLNVLRLGLQSAQKCGHSNLIITEVNSAVSQVDLATQLGLLCTTCGVQTIFSTSSFSEEYPANYSVNKDLLPTLGPSAYYSLVNILQKSFGAVKVNMNLKRDGVSVPHKAKLIVSVDRRSYALDRVAEESVDDIVRPDISGNYENIAEPDIGVVDASPRGGEISANIQSMSVPEYTSTPSITIGGNITLTKAPIITLNPSTLSRVSETSVITKAAETSSRQTPSCNNEDKHGIVVDSVRGSRPGLLPLSTNGNLISNPVVASEPTKPEGLKIKNFSFLKESEFKAEEKRHWTTVDEESGKSRGSDINGEIVAVPPGTKLFASTIQYATPESCGLSPGVYRVTDAGKESILVVKPQAPSGSSPGPDAGAQHSRLNVIQPVSSVASQRLQPVSSVVSQRLQPVSSVVSQRLQPVSSVVSQRLQPVSSVASQRFQPVSSVVSQRLQPVSSVASQRLQPVSSVASQRRVVAPQRNLPRPEAAGNQQFRVVTGHRSQGVLSSQQGAPKLSTAAPQAVQIQQLKEGGKPEPGEISSSTPLQIFSIEVTRALKKKLPNLSNPQIQRIVIDKWSKMSHTEKQVYRKKAKILSSRGAGASVGAISSGLPPGWKRSLVQSKNELGTGRVDIILHTPTGEKLRTKAELAEYTRINNITGIGSGVFDFKRACITVSKSSPVEGGGSITKNTVASTAVAALQKSSSGEQINLGGILKEVITTDSGMKMVRMMVTSESGERREALVPAIPSANGTLKIALPRNFSMKSGTNKEEISVEGVKLSELDQSSSRIRLDKSHETLINLGVQSSTLEQEVEPSILEQEVRPSNLEQDIHSSTLEQEVESSTLEQEGKHSTLEQEGESSTLEQEGEHSTLEQEGESSTLEQEGEHSTLEQTGEPSTLELEGEPLTLEQEVEPSTLEQEGEPSTLEQDIHSSTLEQEVQPSILELGIQLSTLEQEIQPSTLEQEILPSTPEQEFAPTTLEQEVQPSKHEQEIQPSTLEKEEFQPSSWEQEIPSSTLEQQDEDYDPEMDCDVDPLEREDIPDELVALQGDFPALPGDGEQDLTENEDPVIGV